MRLIDTKTRELLEFFGDKVPEYAILSHRWEEGEVTFQDWSIAGREKKKGYFKIDMACRQAQDHGWKYLWVDTNCIDKSSSAELSEAINSMFSWYQKASICYVYLADVESMPDKWKNMTDEYVEHFCQSKWFTRGWTLQELLAPAKMTFYSKDWSKIASRLTLATIISETTQIETRYLCGDGFFENASIAQKMAWVSQRSTTRIEDMAYCMLGIFDVNMPLLYGEGSKSFTRLQEEIIRTSTDHTIFCWTWTSSVPEYWTSLLAPCPQVFKYSKDFVNAGPVLNEAITSHKRTYKMTNAGLSINLPIVQTWSYYLGILNAKTIVSQNSFSRVGYLVCVPIQGYLRTTHPRFLDGMQRQPFPPGPLLISASWALYQPRLYIHSAPGRFNIQSSVPSSTPLERGQFHFLLAFGDTGALLTDRSSAKPEISAGKRVYLWENTKYSIEFDVFPARRFNEDRSLVSVDRTPLPSGFLIRMGNHYSAPCVLFVGVDLRSHQLYRFCSVVPNTLLRETPDEHELLQRLLKLTKETSDEFHVSWGSGIGIIMREEFVDGLGWICLTFITCRGTQDVEPESDDEDDTRSDVAVGDGHGQRYMRMLSSYRGLCG